MKRYLVFAGLDYEPSGGANDLVGSYETCADALRNHAPLPIDWWGHVLDTHTGEVTEIPGQPAKPCREPTQLGIKKRDHYIGRHVERYTTQRGERIKIGTNVIPVSAAREVFDELAAALGGPLVARFAGRITNWSSIPDPRSRELVSHITLALPSLKKCMEFGVSDDLVPSQTSLTFRVEADQFASWAAAGERGDYIRVTVEVPR